MPFQQMMCLGKAEWFVVKMRTVISDIMMHK